MEKEEFQTMLNAMKNDLIAKMNDDNKALREEIKTSNELIRDEVNQIKTKVENNPQNYEDIKSRMEKVEKKLYSDVLAEEPPKKETSEVKSEIFNVLETAKKRIGISPITIDDLNRVAEMKKVRGEECIRYAVHEFLYDEMKMDEGEINELGRFKVHRKDDDLNDKIYLIFENKHSCEYLMRKSIVCKNANIKVFPYIPPQIFARFSDLSKLTYIARKEDTRLKTQINLGEEDLILKTKLKDETEWVVVDNLEEFGEISPLDMSIKWPQVEVKTITSPPKGRSRKNVHNISKTSDEESSPAAKKAKRSEKGKREDEGDDQDQTQKVYAFVKKLEAKSNKKFSQTKLDFPKKK